VNDYNIEMAYIFQIRSMSCSHPNPFILEAHRQLGAEWENIGIMSSSNANHDGCHFTYENGYQDLGDRLYRLIGRDLYGMDLDGVMAPDILQAYYSQEDEITLEIRHSDNLQLIGFPWADFKLEGSTIAVTNGIVLGDRIILNLAGAPTEEVNVTYLTHPGDAPHWITNSIGVGLLSFYNIPVSLVASNSTISTNSNSPVHIDKLYPNPVHEQLVLDVEILKAGNYSLTIYDALGIQVKKETVNLKIGQDKVTIDIAHLANGMYQLSLNDVVIPFAKQ